MQTSYLIVEVVRIPLSGWLSRLLSTRVLFVASALGFTLFSLACAAASSMDQMIVFRAGQGFFGGAMIPTVFATVYLVFTDIRLVRMSMLIGVAATMVPAIGPSLGGWLSANYSWPWLFLVNVPLGLTIAATVWNSRLRSTYIELRACGFALRDGHDDGGTRLVGIGDGLIVCLAGGCPARTAWLSATRTAATLPSMRGLSSAISP